MDEMNIKYSVFAFLPKSMFASKLDYPGYQIRDLKLFGDRTDTNTTILKMADFAILDHLVRKTVPLPSSI